MANLAEAEVEVVIFSDVEGMAEPPHCDGGLSSHHHGGEPHCVIEVDKHAMDIVVGFGEGEAFDGKALAVDHLP